MTRHYDGAPIARHLVFVLRTGAFVVQWEPDHVQDLLTDQIAPFTDADFGQAITDAQLDQLQKAGRISHYDRSYVWLHALPEGARFDRLTVREAPPGSVRYYYLNTTLPEQQLSVVEKHLWEHGLDTRYSAHEQAGLVIILNQDGEPFSRLAEAENAQYVLHQAAPELLNNAAVAFVERRTSSAPSGDTLDTVDVTDLDSLIASQTQRFDKSTRVVVGVDGDADVLQAVGETMSDMGLQFVAVSTGEEALRIIEDTEPDLVIMELVMPDMHAWQLLAKMKANQALDHIPVIIISALGSQSDQVFALTVAKVHDYLVKPVAPALLRKTAWTALRRR